MQLARCDGQISLKISGIRNLGYQYMRLLPSFFSFTVYKHTNPHTHIYLLCAALTVLLGWIFGLLNLFGLEYIYFVCSHKSSTLSFPPSPPHLSFTSSCLCPSAHSSLPPSSSSSLGTGQGSRTVSSLRREEFDLQKVESR